VQNLGTGVADFFYQPAKGWVKSPKDFGRGRARDKRHAVVPHQLWPFCLGLAKGSLSLVSNTVSGLIGAASKVTDSLGKGVAVLSMDDSFIAEVCPMLCMSQRNRYMAAVPAKCRSATDAGLRAVLWQPVARAGRARRHEGGHFRASQRCMRVSGDRTMRDSLLGARDGGVGGFIKGAARGLMGALAKPASGAIGLASQTLRGMGNLRVSSRWSCDASRRQQRFVVLPPQ
jgi:hypothetical protein